MAKRAAHVKDFFRCSLAIEISTSERNRFECRQLTPVRCGTTTDKKPNAHNAGLSFTKPGPAVGSPRGGPYRPHTPRRHDASAGVMASGPGTTSVARPVDSPCLRPEL